MLYKITNLYDVFNLLSLGDSSQVNTKYEINYLSS